jgi:hypothetical protein
MPESQNSEVYFFDLRQQIKDKGFEIDAKAPVHQLFTPEILTALGKTAWEVVSEIIHNSDDSPPKHEDEDRREDDVMILLHDLRNFLPGHQVEIGANLARGAIGFQYALVRVVEDLHPDARAAIMPILENSSASVRTLLRFRTPVSVRPLEL